MTCHSGGAGTLEYFPCRYGGSRVLFRGPRKLLRGDYVAFLGGTETYGRFVERPFPALLEQRFGVECANFGVVNAGVDLYLNDPAVMGLAASAKVKVVQVMGAQNMSNRFYQVHPRRNDRFLRASDKLEALFPEVDFTEFHFNRHMLGRLAEVSEDRYAQILAELRTAWIARMKHVLTLLRGPVALLWFAEHPVPEDGTVGLTGDPLFLTRPMLEALRPRVAALVEVTPSAEARLMATDGMIFNEFEACAAVGQPGPRAHEEACDQLEPVLAPLLGRHYG